MTAQIERRVVSVNASPIRIEQRATPDGKQKPVLVGYAAVFYDEDDPGTQYQLFPGLVERIMPTAFDRCIRENQDVRGLFNHEPDNLLGRRSSGTMRLAVDQRGLLYEIDYDEDDPDHRRVMAKLERGDLTGSSFSFWVPDGGQRFYPEDPASPAILDVRELLDVDVLDVGPVTFPAYDATTSGIRALGDPAEIRSACEAAMRGAVTYLSCPCIRSEDWDEDSALDRVRKWAHEGDRMNYRKFRRAFAWHDGSASETGLKLLHHDIRDGKLHVHSGAVARCLRMLEGDDCGVPEDDRDSCTSHLERHRQAWEEDGTPEEDDGDEDDRARRENTRRMRLRLAEVEA
jgi:HK97 family phage prohead protease